MAAKKADAGTQQAVPGTEVDYIPLQYDNDALLDIRTWEDAVKLAQETLGAEVITSADQEIGDGFALLENSKDKRQLVNVPIFLMGWDFHLGDFGEFVSVRVIVAPTEKGQSVRKLRINDGSDGVYRQLSEYTRKTNRMGGLLVNRGLRASDYYFNADTRETRNTPADGFTPATTFYLNTSA